MKFYNGVRTLWAVEVFCVHNLKFSAKNSVFTFIKLPTLQRDSLQLKVSRLRRY